MSKKILFVAAHYPNRSPGQRYRFEQYLNTYKENGYETKLAYIINAKDDKLFYAPGKYFIKLLLLLKFFIIRLGQVFQAFNYDVIYIFREAYFVGGPFFERLFKLTGKKIIFDFDDAIWLPNVSNENKSFVFLKAPAKTSKICKLADLVVTGNAYLANYALQFNANVVIIPSTIDLNYYKFDESNKNQASVCIGWSGSATTVQHFEVIKESLAKLKNKYGDKICIKLYGDPNYINKELDMIGIKWTHESEVPTINSFDIGIMPLPDNEWTKGKCAMKGLQYMALKVPTIMSPVGVNKEIIQHGVNGYLASTNEEWEQSLELLINDANLRKTIGEAGYQTILKDFCVDANKTKYLKAVDFVLNQK